MLCHSSHSIDDLRKGVRHTRAKNHTHDWTCTVLVVIQGGEFKDGQVVNGVANCIVQDSKYRDGNVT